LDESKAPLYRWYPDGEINICYNAIDRHVDNGDGDNVAFIYDSVYTNIQEKFTYKEVQNRVGRIASILKKRFGVEKGDRVLLYMPMIPVSAFCMLACARIGAIHSVVFGGFAAMELANRIDDCTPKVIITASCGLEPGKVIKYRPIVDEALSLCVKVENASKTVKRIIIQRKD
jgi:propionyl-CoA synthetase